MHKKYVLFSLLTFFTLGSGIHANLNSAPTCIDRFSIDWNYCSGLCDLNSMISSATYSFICMNEMAGCQDGAINAYNTCIKN
jgi:hypothetical protein